MQARLEDLDAQVRRLERPDADVRLDQLQALARELKGMAAGSDDQRFQQRCANLAARSGFLEYQRILRLELDANPDEDPEAVRVWVEQDIARQRVGPFDLPQHRPMPAVRAVTWRGPATPAVRAEIRTMCKRAGLVVPDVAQPQPVATLRPRATPRRARARGRRSPQATRAGPSGSDDGPPPPGEPDLEPPARAHARTVWTYGCLSRQARGEDA